MTNKGFFEESPGNKSNGRLMAFMIVCTGIIIILAGVVQYIIDPEAVSWIAITAAGGSTISLGLGSKLLAKGQEKTETELK